MSCFTLLLALALIIFGFFYLLLARFEYLAVKYGNDDAAKKGAFRRVLIGIAITVAGWVVLLLIFPNV
jgi:hypothetical protein